MSGWKDLEIGNIPSDFFVNERYEIESWNTLTPNHKESPWIATFDDKIRIVEALPTGRYGYRYRLKPLESIRVTRRVYNDLLSLYQVPPRDKGDRVVDIDGRKVEIIEE